jgi:hypothetical protein
MKWRTLLTCSLVAGGLFLAPSAWAAPTAPQKATPPAATAHPVDTTSSPTTFAAFLAGFIPCPLCSPRFPCPRCP